MLIKFIKDTYHPRKRSLQPDYRAGLQYELSELDAQYYIRQGVAVAVKPSGVGRDLIAEILKVQPPRARVVAHSPSASVLSLLNALKIKQPDKVKLKIINPEVLNKQHNEEVIRDTREYFRDKDDISVKQVASYLLDLLQYAVDNNDAYLISKISADLGTLLRLTKYNRKE